MTTYGLRFRLKSSEVKESDFLAAMFERLEEIGWADDMSYPDGDGVYTLWMTVQGDHPQAALATAVGAIADAQRKAGRAVDAASRPTTRFLSAEVEVDTDTDSVSDSELPLLAG